VLGEIEKEGEREEKKGERQTVVTKGASRECFVNSDDVGVSNTRPLFNWLECSLMHQTKIFFMAHHNAELR
jgi:hypothetical protein